jgi:hypothetical protein
MSFAESYEKLLGELGIDPTDEYGCTEDRLLDAETRLGVRLPRALRDYYRKAGEHSLNVAHNRLIAPEKLEFVGGYLLFVEENQRVALWGIAANQLGLENPIVWQGENGSPIVWQSEELTVSEFLEIFVYWQAACGGLKFAGSATELDASIVSVVEQNWPNVKEHNRMRFFVKKGQILILNDDGEGVFSLLAAGTTLEHFDAINEQLCIDWDWSVLDELDDEDNEKDENDENNEDNEKDDQR